MSVSKEANNLRLTRAVVLLAMPKYFTAAQLSERLNRTGNNFGSVAQLVHEMYCSGLLMRKRIGMENQTGRPPKGVRGVRADGAGWEQKKEVAEADEKRASGERWSSIPYEYTISPKGREYADKAWNLLVALDLIENCDYKPLSASKDVL